MINICDMNNVRIFASIIDEVTKKQINDLAESDAYNGCVIRIMPDTHAGKGCTIGSVIQYADRVVPNTVGVDIGCGMLVVKLGKVDIDLPKLDFVVKSFVPSGFSVHETPKQWFDLSKFHADISKKEYILRSIGTLGGGNHFIELNEDDRGEKYLVIHSGSRNLGVQVCNYWQKRAYEKLTDDSELRKEIISRLKAEGREKEIGDTLKRIVRPYINKDLAYLEGEDLQMYLDDMKLCQDYARLNRLTISSIILFHMGLDFVDMFTTIHNYIDIPNKIIRKGAVAAEKDCELIIPMNMRDGSLICKGKGNSDWLCSAPHGAGRIMSRAQAFKNLSLVEYEAEMSSVYTTSVCQETIDEAPMVYKPADVIMKDIADTVEIVNVIRPIYNFKAKESGR